MKKNKFLMKKSIWKKNRIQKNRCFDKSIRFFFFSTSSKFKLRAFSWIFKNENTRWNEKYIFFRTDFLSKEPILEESEMKEPIRFSDFFEEKNRLQKNRFFCGITAKICFDSTKICPNSPSLLSIQAVKWAKVEFRNYSLRMLYKPNTKKTAKIVTDRSSKNAYR